MRRISRVLCSILSLDLGSAAPGSVAQSLSNGNTLHARDLTETLIGWVSDATLGSSTIYTSRACRETDPLSTFAAVTLSKALYATCFKSGIEPISQRVATGCSANYLLHGGPSPTSYTCGSTATCYGALIYQSVGDSASPTSYFNCRSSAAPVTMFRASPSQGQTATSPTPSAQSSSSVSSTAHKQDPTTISQSNQPSSHGSTTSHTAGIAGGTVGGVVGLAVLAGIIALLYRRKRNGLRTVEEQPFDEHPGENLANGRRRQARGAIEADSGEKTLHELPT